MGVVVDTSKSPFARLRPVAVDAVKIADAFWAPRRVRNQAVTLRSQYRQLWDTGRIDNLLRIAGKHDGPFQGRYFNDSDVYKWLEGACWALTGNPDPNLRQLVDEAVTIVEGAQGEDGYINSYFSLEREGERWTDHDLHEMYCAGHLFQAAVAHKRATGSDRLLSVAIRMADCIERVFGPEEGKRLGTDGHPEVEMGLVELYRETGDARYLRLAQFLVDVRGKGLLGSAYDRFGDKYHQDHQPFRELDEIVGHAVRAVYLNAGVADIVAETGESALRGALDRLWASMVHRKMYVSGGIGSRYEGESFGEDYELPNQLAYTETCAAIGSAMWSWRMLLLTGDAAYADLIELQLYNAMLVGVSLDGHTYFYENPLSDEGHHRRSPWFTTACCPPNVARTLASLPGYFYSTDDTGVWIHLYARNDATIPLADGRQITLRQRTDYPWSGNVDIEVDGTGELDLRVRIPAWASEGAAVSVNGALVAEPQSAGTYVSIRRSWSPGDHVCLTLAMPVRQVRSHPYVVENTGRVALLRGPLLYCLEAADNPGIDLRDVSIAPDTSFVAEYESALLGGVTTLSASVPLAGVSESWQEALYATDHPEGNVATGTASIKAVPYFAWANREPGRMRVWHQAGE